MFFLKRANCSEDLLIHIFLNLKEYIYLEAFVELQKDSFAFHAEIIFHFSSNLKKMPFWASSL